jgi:hypothetical protein
MYNKQQHKQKADVRGKNTKGWWVKENDFRGIGAFIYLRI